MNTDENLFARKQTLDITCNVIVVLFDATVLHFTGVVTGSPTILWTPGDMGAVTIVVLRL